MTCHIQWNSLKSIQLFIELEVLEKSDDLRKEVDMI